MTKQQAVVALLLAALAAAGGCKSRGDEQGSSTGPAPAAPAAAGPSEAPIAAAPDAAPIEPAAEPDPAAATTPLLEPPLEARAAACPALESSADETGSGDPRLATHVAPGYVWPRLLLGPWPSGTVATELVRRAGTQVYESCARGPAPVPVTDSDGVVRAVDLLRCTGPRDAGLAPSDFFLMLDAGEDRWMLVPLLREHEAEAGAGSWSRLDVALAGAHMADPALLRVELRLEHTEGFDCSAREDCTTPSETLPPRQERADALVRGATTETPDLVLFTRGDCYGGDYALTVSAPGTLRLEPASAAHPPVELDLATRAWHLGAEPAPTP